MLVTKHRQNYYINYETMRTKKTYSELLPFEIFELRRNTVAATVFITSLHKVHHYFIFM